MRNRLIPKYLMKCILCISLFFLSNKASASHIVGVDLYYTNVSGLTYKVTVVLYGDCGPASSGAFSSLPTSSPLICIYNGATLWSSINLAIEPPSAGVEITPVCPDSLAFTQCVNPSYSIPGIKKFVYSANVTLPSASSLWRFEFNGNLGGATSAGRAAAITNIVGPGSTLISLVDTLNNLSVTSNSNPIMTTIPTPYYCLNQPNSYNPGAVDPNGDFLYFTLVEPMNGSGSTACTPATTISYVAATPAWPGQPLSAATPLRCVASSYSFDAITGQITFTPNFLQRAIVVYNTREFRGGVFVGSCQREMTFLVLACTNLPPSGIYNSATAGTITDSTHFHICSNQGAFSININPTDPEGNKIFVSASGLPAGATFTTTGNGTTAPHSTFSWTTTGTPPGTYVFYVTFADDACPLQGTMTRAFTVVIDPAPLPIAGTFTVCAGATTTLTDPTAGGTWSSSTPSVGTIGSSSGIVGGISGGTTTISYTMSNGCYVTAVVTVVPSSSSPISGPTNVCIGSTITLTHPISGGTWSVTGSAATISSSGVVTGVSAGTVTVSYASSTTCLTGVTSLVVTVSAPLTVAPITGSSTVCPTATITLADATPGGVWSTTSPNASVSAGGVVTGITAGTAVISYSVTNVCGTVNATKTITINPLPVPGTITGPSTVCIGSSISLSSSASGGAWSCLPVSVATVSATGSVTGIGVGTATVSYTVTNSCGTAAATAIITVNTIPTVAPITGPSVVCVAATMTLTCTTPGGTWSTTSTNASVSSGGVVTGITTGTAVISYSVTNMCGTVSVTKTITVNPLPIAGTISGPTSVCVGSTITLTVTGASGTWSSTATGVATVSPTGIVGGIAAGTATISYTVTNSCGTVAATSVITVNPLPTVAPITGPTNVCITSTITLACTTPGGTWSTPSGTASVSPTGNVTGLSYGTATISYSVTNMCGTAVATKIVTIDTLPILGAITGPGTVCAASSITLAITGSTSGTWSSTTTGVATISSSGVVTGVAAGTTTISYVVSNSCGTVFATAVITVNPLPTVSAIVGPTSVCVGLTATMTCTPAGGTWSSTGTATVSPTGVVTGVSGGTATITYTVTNMCGTIYATKAITVNIFPDAGSISGPTEVCVGQTITLIPSITGGTWSGGAPNASVSATGVVTGILPGTATISYTVVNGCGPATVTYVITVNPTPDPGIISGPTNVCEGSTITLTSTVPGGTWSISGGSATITSGGVVTGVSPGTATVSYTVTLGPCSNTATYVVTVDPLPHAGPISGGPMVCTSNTIVMTDPVAGGVWSCTSNASITTSGILTGLTAGTATVSYAVTNSCGTDVATKVVTINLTPDPGVISGPPKVCVGSFITITATVPGGVWSSSTPSVALVTTGGTVSGITPGTTVISYTLSSLFCSAVATTSVLVEPLPIPGIISDPVLCEGSSVALTASQPGGTWSSTGTAGSVSATGVVTGVTAGTVMVSYTVTNSCGPVTTTRLITIEPLPTGTIEGPHTLCIGYPITLTATSAIPGTWNSSNPTVASVSLLGLVTPLTEGTTTISYLITNSAGCTGVVIHIITVAAAPPPGIISGSPIVCVNGDVVVYGSGTNGTWSSSNTTVATIDATTGELHGHSAGKTTITFISDPNSAGCSSKATYELTILSSSPITVGGNITDAKCKGNADGSISLYTGGGSGPWKYLWNNGNTTATLTGLTPGTYSINVLDVASGCHATNSFKVNEPDGLELIPEVKNEECKMANGAISLTAKGGVAPYSYKWYDNSTGTSITALTKGTYSVTVADNNQCEEKRSFDVIEGGCDDVDIQDGLTPNGDGVNDVWKIRGLQNYPNNVVALFDKWGDKVFEQKGYDGTWDGRGRNGAVLPDGTYFYVIKLNAENGAGGKNVLTGSMLIKR